MFYEDTFNPSFTESSPSVLRWSSSLTVTNFARRISDVSCDQAILCEQTNADVQVWETREQHHVSTHLPSKASPGARHSLASGPRSHSQANSLCWSASSSFPVISQRTSESLEAQLFITMIATCPSSSRTRISWIPSDPGQAFCRVLGILPPKSCEYFPLALPSDAACPE